MTEKIDPYKHKERYEEWKKNPITEGVSKYNSELIKDYIFDMETGHNISLKNVKGGRSYSRLNTLRYRMKFFSIKLKKEFNLNKITDITEKQLLQFFKEMREGKIKRNTGSEIKSSDTYAKTFTCVWNWWIRKNKKEGKEIPNITEELSKTSDGKPKWVYINEAQFKLLCNHAKYNYKVLMTFLWDSGLRSPSELINIFVSDLEELNGIYLLNIRDEISKTFGRKIKLLLCSKLLKEYIQQKGLKDNDRLFSICCRVTNQYLSRLGKKVLGDGVSKAGEPYSKLTMYDFRHCSCCYWLPRYKSESALKYRFGWKKSDKIHYYSELLGMKDNITEQDLLVDVTASEIERQLWNVKQERELIEERLKALEKDKEQNDKIILVIKKLSELNPKLMDQLVKGMKKLKS